MNILAFAAAAILPILALVALNFDEMHGYYVYHLPVAGSAIDGYRISYTTMEEKDYRYSILPFHSSNRTPVYDYVELDSPVHEPLIERIEPLGGQAIRVHFSDKNYTVWRLDGTSHKPVPAFSHTETIKVNQTFVTMCRNRAPQDPYDAHGGGGTGLTVFQYRGTDTVEITEARQVVPVEEGAAEDWTGRIGNEVAMYATRDISLEPPERVPVYKFLIAHAYTDGAVPCDYPGVIEHTIDARPIHPADIRAAGDVLYDMYR